MPDFIVYVCVLTIFVVLNLKIMIRSLIILFLLATNSAPLTLYLIWSVDFGIALLGDWVKFRKFWQQFADLKADLEMFSGDYNRHGTSQSSLPKPTTPCPPPPPFMEKIPKGKHEESEEDSTESNPK